MQKSLMIRLAVVTAAVFCASCGTDATPTPTVASSGIAAGGLTNVVETTSQGSVPGDIPQTKTFSSPGQLSAIEQSLEQHHIVKLQVPTEPNSCTGGHEFVIVLTSSNSEITTLTAYSCAGTITGNIGGDAQGLLTDLSSLS